jgi:formate hydrogenlyase subunit 3/multisubunit Na+/H+ antiporter MnhD subunit
MGLDLRIPIGIMFALLGVLFTAYGAATLGRPGTSPTGLPIVLIWGAVMLLFGVVMLALSRRRA